MNASHKQKFRCRKPAAEAPLEVDSNRQDAAVAFRDAYIGGRRKGNASFKSQEGAYYCYRLT